MKSRLYSWIVAVCLCWVAGCGPQSRTDMKNWLLVSFDENVPVTYHFISKRNITIDLSTGSSGKKAKPQTISESLDMVITYTPTEVDPFGLTTIQGECQSAKVSRSSISGRGSGGRDAMESLPSRTFTIQVTPTGEIADASDLMRVVGELGEIAFAQKTDQGRRIKNPDMINDFIAMQWHLWDSTSTIEEPLAGMKPGQSWQIKQWLPWPAPIARMPMRTTTYTLDSFITGPDGHRKAVIKSTYEIAEPEGEERFPYPYEGMFQMRGIMGFLRNFKFLSLEGTGTQIFNMEKGLIESDQQDYTMKVNAAFMLPLGDSLPMLTVEQTTSIEQIETP